MSRLPYTLCSGFLAALTVTACSDPSYGKDGKNDKDGEHDASTAHDASASLQSEHAADASSPRDSTLDTSQVADAAQQTPAQDSSQQNPPQQTDGFPTGKYAVLVRFYGAAEVTGGGWFAEEITVLADVQRVNNGLQMSWKTCAYDGRAKVFPFPNIDYAGVDVSKFPVRTLQLVLNGNTFQTLGDAALIGYQEVPNCTPQAYPDRPWLGGAACSCPTASSLLPTSPNDCRVIDLDGDMLPGFTVAWTGGTNNRSYSRIKDSSQLLNGVIAPDGEHRAQLSANYENYQLGCDTEPCSRYPVKVCPLEKNPARFRKLDDNKEWTCGEVVDVVQNSNKLGLGQINASGC